MPHQQNELPTTFRPIVWRALVAILIGGVGTSGCSGFSYNDVAAENDAGPRPDASRAKQYLDDVCKIGPRVSGTKGMERQQELLIKHFEKFGAKIGKQRFVSRHPLTGERVDMVNLIVSWHPEKKERVLLACHYDTRPFPDQDRRNPRGIFLGANDGASGVALFMELAHHMKDLKPTYGVDFVFFDAEELVYDPNPPNTNGYFLGSRHFATEYAKRPPEHRYHYGVVADMVGDRELTLFLEKNSMRFAPELTRSIWKKAEKLGVREFVYKLRHEVEDDHLPLNEIAKIPSANIIDFDYPHWHTTRDVPAACSGKSLAKVGRVLLAWLEDVPEPAKK